MARRDQREEEEESGSDHESEERTFVAGQRQTFVDEGGYAIGFYIHKSVNKPEQRLNLTTNIENNGGVVYDTEDYADTVIIDVKEVDRGILQMDYNCRPGRWNAPPIYVEPMSFVQRCMREGIVRHRLPLKQGMGGVVGRSRTSFTEEDDDNLSYYLSRVIPVEKDGGRSGNNVYIYLEQMGNTNPEDYAWAQRHPWSSWRQRYKNNARRLDILIEHYANREPPSEHTRYIRRRGWSSRHQRYVGPYVSDEETENLDFDDVEAEDVNVHQKTRTLHAKRRRPSSFRASLPSAPAKKRRTDAYGQETRRSGPLNLRARREGKKKAALPSDDDNNESLSHNSLFTGDEADPIDLRFESPNPLEYVEPQAELNIRSPSFPAMPQTSQMTLVETNPPSSQSYPPFRDIQSLPRPSTNMPRLPDNAPAEIGYEDVAPLIVSNGHISPPSIHRSRQASEANVHRPPSPIGERVDASPVVSPVPAPRPPAAKKRVGRPKLMASVVAQTEPPYRNTRSRSRSVEPSVPAVSKRRNRKEQKDVSQLEPLPESRQEEEGVESAVPEAIAPISGTLEEEMDVENLLVAATDISGISGIAEMPERDVEMSPPRAPGARSKSQALDTDDEQTRRDLHQATKQPFVQYPTSKYTYMDPKDVLKSFNDVQYPTSKYTDMDPRDVLKSFNAKLSSASHSRQSSILPLQSSRLTHQGRGTSVASSIVRRIIDSTPQPSTPVRFLQPRKKSTSSTESFPVVGTRASDTKKKYEQVEKRSPYRPPAGTRAAQHALSR